MEPLSFLSTSTTSTGLFTDQHHRLADLTDQEILALTKDLGCKEFENTLRKQYLANQELFFTHLSRLWELDEAALICLLKFRVNSWQVMVEQLPAFESSNPEAVQGVYLALLSFDNQQDREGIHTLLTPERTAQLFLRISCEKKIKEHFSAFLNKLTSHQRTALLGELFKKLGNQFSIENYYSLFEELESRELFKKFILYKFIDMSSYAQVAALNYNPRYTNNFLKQLNISEIAKVTNIAVNIQRNPKVRLRIVKQVVQIILQKNSACPNVLPTFIDHFDKHCSIVLKYLIAALPQKYLNILSDIRPPVAAKLFDFSFFQSRQQLDWFLQQLSEEKISFCFLLQFPFSIFINGEEYASDLLNIQEMKLNFQNLHDYAVDDNIPLASLKQFQKIPSGIIAIAVNNGHFDWLAKNAKFFSERQFKVFAQAIPESIEINEILSILQNLSLRIHAKLFLLHLSPKHLQALSYKAEKDLEQAETMSKTGNFASAKTALNKYGFCPLIVKQNLQNIDCKKFQQTIEKIADEHKAIRLKERSSSSMCCEDTDQEEISTKYLEFFTIYNLRQFGVRDGQHINSLGITSNEDIEFLGINMQSLAFFYKLKGALIGTGLITEDKLNEIIGLKKSGDTIQTYCERKSFVINFGQTQELRTLIADQSSDNIYLQEILNIANSAKSKNQKQRKSAAKKIFYKLLCHVKSIYPATILQQYFKQQNLERTWKVISEEKKFHSLAKFFQNEGICNKKQALALSEYLRIKRAR